MGTGRIVDAISDVLLQSGGQMVSNALNLKATDPMKPSLMSMVTWAPADDPRGYEEQVKVSTNPSAGTFAEGGPFNQAGRAEYEDFELGFSRYHVVLEATNSQLAKFALAPDPQAKISNFLDVSFQDAFDATFDKMESDAFTNDPSSGDADGFTGLEVVASGSNVYGGIDASVHANTGAHVNALGGALTMTAMEDTSRVLRDTNGGGYDVILTSETVLKKYTRLDNASNPSAPIPHQMTFTGPDGIQRVYSAGFVSAYFEGRPVIPLTGYPTDVMDYLRRAALIGRILRNWETKRFEVDDKVRWVLVFEALIVVRNRRKNFARLDTIS